MIDEYIKIEEAVEKFTTVNARSFDTDQIVYMLNRLPKYEMPNCNNCAYKSGEWIPCSERLPEENTDILVTYVEKDEKRIAPVNYGCGAWFDCFFNKVLNPFGVLAWMPLPKPYKGGEDK